MLLVNRSSYQILIALSIILAKKQKIKPGKPSFISADLSISKYDIQTKTTETIILITSSHIKNTICLWRERKQYFD